MPSRDLARIWHELTSVTAKRQKRHRTNRHRGARSRRQYQPRPGRRACRHCL